MRRTVIVRISDYMSHVHMSHTLIMFQKPPPSPFLSPFLSFSFLFFTSQSIYFSPLPFFIIFFLLSLVSIHHLAIILPFHQMITHHATVTNIHTHTHRHTHTNTHTQLHTHTNTHTNTITTSPHLPGLTRAESRDLT